MASNLAERVKQLCNSYYSEAPDISNNTYHQLRPLLTESGFELRQEGKQRGNSPIYYGAVHVRGFQELFLEVDLLTLEPGFSYIYGTSFGHINPTLQDRLAIKTKLERDEKKRCLIFGTGVGLGVGILYVTFTGFSEAVVIPPLVIGFFGFKIGQERRRQLEDSAKLKNRSYQAIMSKVKCKTGMEALEAALR